MVRWQQGCCRGGCVVLLGVIPFQQAPEGSRSSPEKGGHSSRVRPRAHLAGVLHRDPTPGRCSLLLPGTPKTFLDPVPTPPPPGSLL